MRYFVLAIFMTSSVSAQPLLVTNTFNNNSVADADAVNRNFTDITNGLNTRLNITIGYPANTAVGYLTLTSNTSGVYNTANGFQAALNNTTGYENTASGALALYNNTQGYDNTAIGKSALSQNTTGYENTASGAYALYNTTVGDANTANGFKALFNNTDGIVNTAIGAYALFLTGYGNFNTASGYRALYSNVTGDHNTASGTWALSDLSQGEGNTAVGSKALEELREGDHNTAIGYLAGSSRTSIFNSTAIGYGATVRGNGQVQIGNDDIANVYLGRRAFPQAGTDEVAANLHLFGDLYVKGSVVSSDGRLKENVTAITEGLSLVNDLNPVSYHRIDERRGSIEMGLVAQEVQATLKAHNLNSGMIHQSDSNDYLYLRYNDLMAPMIRAIQELDDASEAKDKQIASLEQKLASQQEELLAIVQSQQEQIAQLQQMVEHQFAAR